MRFLSMLRIFLTCLVCPYAAAALKGGVSSSAPKPEKVKTKVMVLSLEEVAHGLQVEADKALELSRNGKASCKKADREYALSNNKGNRTFAMATAEYQKADSEVASLRVSLEKLKLQITKSNQELDTLQASLKKARKDNGELKKNATAALRQMDVAISKVSLREGKLRHRKKLTLARNIESLERLGEGLSFVQTSATQPAIKESKPVLILKADEQSILKASEETQKGFNEKEKKLLALIKAEREKLRGLEAILADTQPAFTNKLMQAMEINRTLAATTRGMKLDTEMNNKATQKCKMVDVHLVERRAQLSRVTSDIRMAAKAVGSMDTALFLSKDLVSLKRSAAASLLQLTRRHWHWPSSEETAVLVQADAGAADENYNSEQGQAPFDKVTEIISGLIASMKAQANEDVTQDQFCQDSLSQNRRDRLVKKNAVDALSSTIHWSKMAIARLDEDAKYFDKEWHRLDKIRAEELKKVDKEMAKVGKTVKVHKTSGEVVTKALLALSQLCANNLLQKGISYAQEATFSTKLRSRFSQCKEAQKFLESASKGLQQLDAIEGKYFDKFTLLSESIAEKAKAARDVRGKEVQSTKAARAQRALELASATKDIGTARQELALIEKSKQELEQQCTKARAGVTREDRMAARKEELRGLREALSVLSSESESVPV